MRFIVMAAMASLTLTACGDKSADNRSEVQAQGFEIADARVRRPLAGRDVTAGFMVIESRAGDALVSVSSPKAEIIEMHTMTMDEAGVMRMRKVDSWTVETDSPLELAPGGNHLMIFGANITAEDTVFPLVLTFEKSGDVSVEAEIFAGGAPKPAPTDN